MKTYVFETYEPALKKSFVQERNFKSESDFRLYCFALWSGNWKLLQVKDI